MPKRFTTAALAAVLISAAGYGALAPRMVLDMTREEYIRELEDPARIMEAVAEWKEVAPVDLVAMAVQESWFGAFPVGDKGCSGGWFHMNRCAHPEAEGIIGDIVAEAEWAAGKLVSYGYRIGDELAIRTAFAKYNAPARPNFAHADRVIGRRERALAILENR